MGLLKILLVIVLTSLIQLNAQTWGRYTPMGSLSVGGGASNIYFDSTNKVIFNSNGYICSVDLKSSALSKVTKSINLNGEEISSIGFSISSMAFSNRSYLMTKKDTLIYVSEDTTIIFSINDIPSLKTGTGLIAYYDNKYYIVHGILGNFQGMHIFDELKLSMSYIEPEKLFNCYPKSTGTNNKFYGIYKDKLYYYTLHNRLLQYNTQTGLVDTIDFSSYIRSLDRFKFVANSSMIGNILICNSKKDFQYFTYNVETGNFLHYDLKNTIIHEDYDGFFDDYDSLSPDFNMMFNVKADYKGGLMAIAATAQPEKYPSRLYFKPPEGEWKRIPFPDSTDITSFFEPDKNNTWWFYSQIKEEFREGGKSIFAAIPLNPYDDTSVEKVEGMPTIVPISVRPNPAVTYTEVRFYLNPYAKYNVKFKIYDYMGNEIKELNKKFSYDAQFAIATKHIDVTGLKCGVYYLVVDNGIELQSIGFVVD